MKIELLRPRNRTTRRQHKRTSSTSTTNRHQLLPLLPLTVIDSKASFFFWMLTATTFFFRTTTSKFFPYSSSPVGHLACMAAASMIQSTSSRRASSSTSSDGTAAKPAALIFLHGLGDTPSGWSSSLEDALPRLQPRLASLSCVFPAAPTIPITINGGMRMPGWFDLHDWPIAVGVRDDPDGEQRAVDQMNEIIDGLVEQGGISRDRIVVGGFSQGGVIALLTTYYNNRKKNEEETSLAGCAVLSGWLPKTSAETQTPSHTKVPLFWAHGEYDDKVLFEQQDYGIRQLEEHGVVVERSSYPMGHQSVPQEIEALADFLDRTLYGLESHAEKTEL